MAAENTVPIKFIVHCGNFKPDGERHTITFQEQAPAVLCRPTGFGGAGPTYDDNGPFLTSLIDRHHGEVMRSRAWQCVTCEKPAAEILHSTIAFLSPNPIMGLFGFELGFKPSVIDHASPICISGGACDRAATKVVHRFTGKELLGEGWRNFDCSKTCDNCGKKSGLKVCAGCKFIAYCNKECQAQGWKFHKEQCKNAQKEKRERLLRKRGQ